MTITGKLVLTVLASTAVVFAINGYFRVRREATAFQVDMVQDAQMLGQVFEKVLADVWLMDGQARVRQLLADANASTSQWRFRWLPWGTTATGAEGLELEPSHIVALQQGEAVKATARDARGQATLHLFVPVRVGQAIPGVLEITEGLAPVHAYVRQTIRRTVVAWGGLVVLSGVLLLLIGVVVIGRPMRRVIEKTRRIGTGDLEGPLHVRTHDEFAEVAAALNQLCEQLKASQEAVRAEMEARLQTLEQLRHADRLKTIGTLVSGMAHELGTPLNVVSGRAGLIASGRLSPAEVADSARIIKEQVQRMTGLIRQLLDFVRRKTPKRMATDLRALAQHTLDLLEPLAEPQQAVLTLKTEEAPVNVWIDAGQMQQVLINLVTNAWQAMPQGGPVEVRIHRVRLIIGPFGSGMPQGGPVEVRIHRTEGARPPSGIEPPRGSCACVAVTDQGKGIAEADLPHIFDPFFTTKGVGQGTGLGLSVAYGIVRDHGGWIEVTSQPGAGACFSVYLPMEDEPCPDAS